VEQPPFAGRQNIEVSALVRMQELAKRYMLGIRVDQVQLKNVNPPAEVQASFNEVKQSATGPRKCDQFR
jgi:membrane protease subunit HflK